MGFSGGPEPINGKEMRIIRFYKRFKNQHRIHKKHLSLWVIVRISWIQSRKKECDNERRGISKKKWGKRMKYKVELRCEQCGTLINETVELDNFDVAKMIEQDALLNPLIGWCKRCDVKPTPHIIEIKD